ncbi:MAG: citrate lyase acyl carrier protein [Bacilli bacterium]|nr:citrate lyase acyl carrier protein [Bacilli bacterium]
MKKGSAGTIESNDVKITVEEALDLQIKIESIVFEFYGDQIMKVIKDTLDELGIEKVHVLVQDKGALDYTIKSRLMTALERMKDDE